MPGYARFPCPPPTDPAGPPGWPRCTTSRSSARRPRRGVTAYLAITLVELARLAAPSTAGLRQQGELVLARVFEVVDERYAGRLSTSDVAAAVGLTPGYLTTLVRERTGRTVLDWITERRMAAARALLLTTTSAPSSSPAGSASRTRRTSAAGSAPSTASPPAVAHLRHGASLTCAAARSCTPCARGTTWSGVRLCRVQPYDT